MQVTIEPLAPELEASIRNRLAANPFIKFVGIQAPQLGRGYARFLLPFKPELANSIGLLQGGVIAALADEAVAFALYSLSYPAGHGAGLGARAIRAGSAGARVSQGDRRQSDGSLARPRVRPALKGSPGRLIKGTGSVRAPPLHHSYALYVSFGDTKSLRKLLNFVKAKQTKNFILNC